MRLATVRNHLRRYPIHTLLIELVLMSAVVWMAGCASTRTDTSNFTAASYGLSFDEIEPRLREEILRWEDTPHEMGGTDHDGMDCSAFVQRVYADAFRVDLPRSTRGQVRTGHRVGRGNLRAGDLVFFKPPTKVRHVGIYLSNGEFAHVSSTEGVTVSELDLPYWRHAYWTSRRILADRPAAAGRAAFRADSDPQPSRPAGRVGW